MLYPACWVMEAHSLATILPGYLQTLSFNVFHLFFMFLQRKFAVKGFPTRRVSRYDHCLLKCFCYSFCLHRCIHRYSCSFGKVQLSRWWISRRAGHVGDFLSFYLSNIVRCVFQTCFVFMPCQAIMRKTNFQVRRVSILGYTSAATPPK